VDATASYAVTLSGVNIATVAIDLKDDGARYSVDVDGNVSGLGQLVASGTAEITAAGSSRGQKLAADSFGLTTRTKAESFSVSVGYAGGDVSTFKIDPPLASDYGRVPIERAHLRGVSDAISSFIIKGKQLDRSICEQKLKIFTGVERFDVTMRYAKDEVATSQRTGYQGPVVLCAVRYEPISGHFTTSEITSYLANSDRILIWYAPLSATGYFVPYRVLMSTSAGDLSMVLTRIETR